MASASPVFSDQETAWHRTARFQLVPWVARLLGNGPLRGKSEPLPVGNPDSLTDETVDAIRDMMNRAAWQFLARDCGWRQCYAIEASNSGGNGSFSRRRLWESGSRDRLPGLKFTSEAIDLVIAIYNATRSDQRVESAKLPECLEANGDLLLNHLIFRRLTGSAQALGVAADHHWRPWYANPLNALLHIVSFGDSHSALPDWDRLAEPDLAAFFPWIGARIAKDWQVNRRSIQQSHEISTRWFGNLAALTGELIEGLTGRPDLLIFLLEPLSAQAGSATGDRENFEEITASLNRQQRESAAIPWAEFLKLAEVLRTIHRSCLDRHPVERSGPEKGFLAAWEEMTFSEVSDTLRDLRQRIRPAIS